MSKQLFIRTEEQRIWLEKLATVEESFKENAQIIDEESVFLLKILKGYAK